MVSTLLTMSSERNWRPKGEPTTGSEGMGSFLQPTVKRVTATSNNAAMMFFVLMIWYFVKFDISVFGTQKYKKSRQFDRIFRYHAVET